MFNTRLFFFFKKKEDILVSNLWGAKIKCRIASKLDKYIDPKTRNNRGQIEVVLHAQ